MERWKFCRQGMWVRNWQQMLDQIALCGFNSIRLPYSNQLFDAASAPNGIDFVKNPDLQGLTGLEIMDRVVRGAGQRGFRGILDRHRPHAAGQSPLWYTDHVSEERWIRHCPLLPQRHRRAPSVIAAPFHHHPHTPPPYPARYPTTP